MVIWEIYTSHLAQSKAKMIGETQVLVLKWAMLSLLKYLTQ